MKPKLCPLCNGLKLHWKPKQEGDPISGHIACPYCEAKGFVMAEEPDDIDGFIIADQQSQTGEEDFALRLAKEQGAA